MTLLLAIAAALAGFGAGYLAKSLRDQANPPMIPPVAVHTSGSAPAPVLEPTTGPRPEPDPGAGTEEPSPTSDPPDETVLRAAREVLEVVDRLTNPELTRRLVEAVVLLPPVAAVRPLPGDQFDPLVHEWSGNRVTDDESEWNTVAVTLAPGAIFGRQLLRPAHVVVFEPPEEQ